MERKGIPFYQSGHSSHPSPSFPHQGTRGTGGGFVLLPGTFLDPIDRSAASTGIDTYLNSAIKQNTRHLMQPDNPLHKEIDHGQR